MFGSMAGNIIGTLYLLTFQICGMILSRHVFREERRGFRILMGSVLGSVGLHWCPILFSFPFGFTILSHVLGLILFLAITVSVRLFVRVPGNLNTEKLSLKNYPFLIVCIPLFLFFCVTLWNHTIAPFSDGSIHTGQCTFSDMNMHLGFITSIAKQQIFPPHYSIFPTARLSYPFLADTISSSIYLFGATLRYAYMLPMWVAILQVLFGAYSFAADWLKKPWKAFLAFVFFFFNGGFGIIYFLNGTYTWEQLMTGFYKTPTNLVDVNVRWTNVMVDMLLPQRATLFGWALLFPTICLIHKAWAGEKRRYFWTAGCIAGALPMVHTHSFLALGILCLGWLTSDLAKQNGTWSEWEEFRGPNSPIFTRFRRLLIYSGIGGVLLFAEISAQNPQGEKEAMSCVGLCVTGLVVLGLYLCAQWFEASANTKKRILKSWGVFLLIVALLASGQLLFWTFHQVSTGRLLRGHLNWANVGDARDPYVLFYLKNVGIVMVLLYVAWILAKKKNVARVLPAFIIWYICELIVFQPNEYDNNKLLLVAYLLICCFVADAVADWIAAMGRGLRKLRGGKVLSPVITGTVVLALGVLACSSAVLSMVREYYSGTAAQSYFLYDADDLEACRFIEENISPDSIILTADHHNNAVASLTGRNIVCGSSVFLFYHGVDYQERASKLSQVYEQPVENADLLSEWQVDYVYVGRSERNKYPDLNEEEFERTYPCIYSKGSVKIYQVK